MTGRRVTVVGDALLDRDVVGTSERLCPDAPVPVIDEPRAVARPGGAGLAAMLSASDGAEVTLITPLGEDGAGRELTALAQRAGVQVIPLPLTGSTAEKVRIRAGTQSLVRLDYGTPGTVGPLTVQARRALDRADAVLVSDYGRGITADSGLRTAIAEVEARVPVVWDPHPRGAPPVPGVRLVTPNRAEAAALIDAPLEGLNGVASAAEQLVARWQAAGVAVTLGVDGALLVSADGTALAVPASPVDGGDPCGAGDRFAARAATLLAGGALLSEAVVDAVATASAFVAAGGAAAAWPAGAAATASGRHFSAASLVDQVRARGGTVVATGGCFDLLHAGHVRMLQAARTLGDCLVVCINSDDSVRRLKGPDRPLVTAEDRAAVLAGLACVDAVAVFEEDTPEAVLATLRPDVWAKGADYAVADLPEAPLLRSWGGQAVVLPYLDGRSTTRLIEEATRRAGT